LIVLIANGHLSTATGVHSGSRQLGKPQTGKDQFHEICPVVSGQAHKHMAAGWRPAAA
jgi:hypothetical protein